MKKISKLFISLICLILLTSEIGSNVHVSANRLSNNEIESHEPPIIPSPVMEEPAEPSYYSAPEVKASEEEQTVQQAAMKDDALSLKPASVQSLVYDEAEQLKVQMLNISAIQAKYTQVASKSSLLSSQEPVLSKEQILSLLILGASVEDIYEAAYLSQESGMEPLELYKQKTENLQSWDKLRLSTTGQQAEPSSVTNEVYSVTKEVYGPSDTLFPEQFLLNGLSTDSSTNTLLAQINAVISNTEMQSINQTNKPQYSDRSDSSELIDPSSGSLVWKENQISLPGRDGLDLNIGVMFSSSQSVNSDYNFLANQYELGVGMGFRFPSLQKTYSNDLYYHNGEGAVYEVKLSEPQGLKDYKSKDIRFAEDRSSFTNGQDFSRYYLEYADKKREYFGGDNLRLLGIVDRYGNNIVFNYTQIYDKAYYTSSYLLTQITDSTGRKVNFKYDPMDKRYVYNNTDLVADENLVVSVLDLQGNKAQEVTYTRGRSGYMKYWTSSVTGQTLYSWVGDTTLSLKMITQNEDKIKFGYNQIPIYTNGERKKFKDGDDGTSQLQAYQLEKIEYPHSQTVYKYMDQFRNYGVKGGMIERVIASRYDQVIRNGNYSGEYNKAAYSYIGSYDGYDTYYKDRTGDYQYSTTVTSVLNNIQTTYAFNGKGQLLSTTNVAANGEKSVQKNTAFHAVIDTLPTASETWEYGAGDTDATANKLYTYTEYDVWGNPLSTTRPLTEAQRSNPTLLSKNKTTYTYEPNFQLMASRSGYPSENANTPFSESISYSAQGRVLAHTNAAGELTSYSYEMSPDGLNRVSQMTAVKTSGGKTVSKGVVTYGWDTVYAYPTLEETYSNIGLANQQIVNKTTAYDMGTGRVLSVKDGSNQTVSYAYDALGRLTLVTYPEFTNQTGAKYSITETYTYKNNQISTNFDTENAGMHSLAVDSYRTVKQIADGEESTTHGIAFYDGLGQLLLEETWDGYNGKFVKNQYHYDSLGRPVYSVDETGNTLSVGYDAWGRQNRATDAKGDLYVSDYSLKSRTSISYLQPKNSTDKWNYVESAFDAWGNQTAVATYKDWPANQQQISETYTYDFAGNVLGYTDPNRNVNMEGVTTSYTYDALGRLSSVKDALNQTTRYTYDGNGQIAKVTIQARSGAEQTLNTKTYNELGLITTKQDGASQSEKYTYNTLGQLSSKMDRNGSSFTYIYDESGQLKSSKSTGTVNGVTQSQELRNYFGESGPTNRTIRTFTNNVQTASQSQTVDSLNQVQSTYAVAGNHSSNILNQYDVLGRLTRVQDQYMGFYTLYQYNKQQLQKVQTNGSSTLSNAASANVQYSYYPNHLVNTITYPTLTDGSTLMTTYTYKKALGWIESMTNAKGNSNLSNFSYEYDNNGNQIAITESRTGSTAQTTRYTYDALNRLLSITKPDGRKSVYTYDVRGNRQTLSDTGGQVTDFVDTSYTYDLQNTLTSVTKAGSTTSFEYYADGLRYAKTTGTTKTQVNYNLNGQVIAEEKITNGSYVEQASFVRGDRVLVKKDKKASADYYYLYNGHGDVVQIVDTSGKVKNNYVYDEWGNITTQTEGISNSFKYAGESYDPETGLYYLRARYYDPGMGRFLNEDTYEGQIDNPLTQNLYTYVVNNPLIYSDPTGNAHENAGYGGPSGGSGAYSVPKWVVTDFKFLKPKFKVRPKYVKPKLDSSNSNNQLKSETNSIKNNKNTAEPLKRVYKPSEKHDPKSGWGSPNPIPDSKIGQELLDSAYSSSKNKQLYNIYNGKLIKFQPDSVSDWHPYEVANPAKEVPADVLRQMLNDGKITKVEYNKMIRNNN